MSRRADLREPGGAALHGLARASHRHRVRGLRCAHRDGRGASRQLSKPGALVGTIAAGDTLPPTALAYLVEQARRHQRRPRLLWRCRRQGCTTGAPAVDARLEPAPAGGAALSQRTHLRARPADPYRRADRACRSRCLAPCPESSRPRSHSDEVMPLRRIMVETPLASKALQRVATVAPRRASGFGHRPHQGPPRPARPRHRRDPRADLGRRRDRRRRQRERHGRRAPPARRR